MLHNNAQLHVASYTCLLTCLSSQLDCELLASKNSVRDYTSGEYVNKLDVQIWYARDKSGLVMQ